MARKRRNQPGIKDLSDELLISILGKLPLKQAMRCSVVSKRWKLLTTFLPNLKFSSTDFSDDIIDGIFQRHSGSIELFEFRNTSPPTPHVIIHNICEWIQCAALKNVKEIKIEEIYPKPEIPNSIFLCHQLRSLAAKNFCLTNIPACFGSFGSLTTLNFDDVDLHDKTIEDMLRFCPILEILILNKCSGLERLNICSDRLISLDVSSSLIKAITVKCPRLMSIVLRNCNCREIEAFLPACLSLSTNFGQVEMLTTLQSVRNITLFRRRTYCSTVCEKDVEILSEFPNLEQLCLYHVDHFVLMPSVISTSFALRNLKQIHLTLETFNYDPTLALTSLLRHAPDVKTVLLSLRNLNSKRAVQLLNKLIDLKEEFVQTKILLSRRTFKEARYLNCVPYQIMYM